jgi:hypothetical protein
MGVCVQQKWNNNKQQENNKTTTPTRRRSEDNEPRSATKSKFRRGNKVRNTVRAKELDQPKPGKLTRSGTVGVFVNRGAMQSRTVDRLSGNALQHEVLSND